MQVKYDIRSSNELSFYENLGKCWPVAACKNFSYHNLSMRIYFFSQQYHEFIFAVILSFSNQIFENFQPCRGKVGIQGLVCIYLKDFTALFSSASSKIFLALKGTSASLTHENRGKDDKQ